MSRCLWKADWLCGDCEGNESCPNYIKEEVEVKQDKQLTLFEL